MDSSRANNNERAIPGEEFLNFFTVLYSNMYVCLCVFFPFILDIKSSLDVPAGVTQEEGHTGFLVHLSAVRALIFLAIRIQPFLSLVNREVELCVLTIQSFSTPVGHFYFSCSVFLVRKIPFAGIELTSQRVRGLRGTSELPGRPAIINGTLARSLEPVVTECKEHTIHTQTQIVASRKPKEIKHTHEGEANFTT